MGGDTVDCVHDIRIPFDRRREHQVRRMFRSRGALVFRWPFYAVDDQKSYRAFGGFEFEAELLFDGGKDGRAFIGGWGWLSGVCVGSGVVGRPFEVHIEWPSQASLVDDCAVQDEGELTGEALKADTGGVGEGDAGAVA